MRKYFLFWLLVIATLLSLDAFGAKRYWIKGSAGYWNNTANWSSSSGGGGGSSVPGSNDTAYFDGNGLGNDTLDVNISIKRIDIVAGFTGKIVQGAKTVTIGTGASTLAGGTFEGGSASITLSGAFTISGCAFTSTSGTLSTSANFTVSSGSFTHNSGKVSLTATSTLNISRVGGVTFYDLEFAPTSAAATFTITSTTTPTVSHTLSYAGTKAITLNTGTIDVTGNISTASNSQTGGGGSATLNIDGTGSQTLTGNSTIEGGALPKITVNKGGDTLHLASTITVANDWTSTAGPILAGTSTVAIVATSTITIANTGGTTFYNLTFDPVNTSTVTLTSTTTTTVSHKFISGGVYALTFNSGTLNVTGDIDLTNTQDNTPGSASIVINGTGRQTLTGQASFGHGHLPNITINKSADTLFLANIVSIGGDWTYTAGIVSAGTSTVEFDFNKTITGSLSLYNVAFNAPTIASTYTIATGTIITINGTLSIGGAFKVVLNTGDLYAKGDITISNTSSNGGGTGTLTINGTGNQTISSSSSDGRGHLPNTTINKSSGTLSLSGHISVFGTWTYTAGTISPGSSVIYFNKGNTITGSHTLANVTFEGGFTYIISGGTTLTTTGTLSTIGSGAVTLNTGTIYAQGNIDVSGNTGNGGGNATIRINGSGTQRWIGSTSALGRLCNIEINKSATDSLLLSNSPCVAGNWTYTNGIIAGTGTLILLDTKTVTGTETIHVNLWLTGTTTTTITIATGTIVTVTGTLTIAGSSNSLSVNTGDIYVQGDVTVTNTGTNGGGTGAININGTGNQTLTGSGTAGQGRLPKITVDKTSGTLTLASVISVANNWTYVQGTVDAYTNTSTVDFYGALNLDGQGTSATMPFYNATTAGGTITLTGNLDVDHNLTINSTTTLSAGSNAITVGGNWSDNGTWTYATSSVTFDGSGYNTIAKSSGTETFYNLGFNRSAHSQTLLNPVKVNNVLTMTAGHVKTTSTNILELIDNATLSGGANGAYVCGPMRKTGNDAFTFPMGDTTLADNASYHPIAMTAPGSTGDQFDATYFPAAQGYGSTLGTGIAAVSSCEYWTFKRVTGSSTPTLTLGWNSNCDNSDYSEMHVALWNGSQWNDIGRGTVTVSSPSGSIAATSASSFGVNPAPVTIGYTTANKTYTMISKTPDGGYFTANGNELYFGFNEEYKDADGLLTYSITNLATNRPVTLVNNANNAAVVSYGNNMYRIDLYDNSNTALSSGYYMLEVKNEKNEKWYLRIKI